MVSSISSNVYMRVGLEFACGIPGSIRETGVEESAFLAKLDEMALAAFDDQCTSANPRYPLVDELKELYRKAYYGEPLASLAETEAAGPQSA